MSNFFKAVRSAIKQKNSDLWYISPLRDKEQDASFKVNRAKNTWYDFSLGEGGTIIDLVMKMYSENVSQALQRLSSNDIKPVSQTIQKEKSTDSNVDVIYIKDLTSSSLIQYLTERKINIDLAKQYFKEINYKTGDKEYFSIWFKNNSNWFETRNKYFKGSISPKDITTINPNNNESLSIFEGCIDFLSCMTYFKSPVPKWCVVVLNSTSLKDKVIDLINKNNFKKVYFFLDNDKTGKDTLNNIIQKIKVSYVDKSHIYNGFKDFNDFLINKDKK